jgi:branched-chain amino acid aminotransferase
VAHPKYVFLNDAIVPWEDARVHVSTVAFKFGTAVFEGIRGYWNEKEGRMYVFQLAEHMQRLAYSQRAMRFDAPLDVDMVAERTLELLRANDFREGVHIMTTVFVNGFGDPLTTGPVGLAITAAPRKHSDRMEKGVSAQVSSWMRAPDTAMPMRIKCNANYQNGRLAGLQAKADGYDTAILLNSRGKVAEGPAMCFCMIRDGKLITPSVNSDILESITRRTVLALAREYLEIETIERDVDRSELYAAEEAFFCGTAWEITPVVAIDRMPVGTGVPGPLTRRLQQTLLGIATGTVRDHAEWRTPLDAGKARRAPVRRAAASKAAPAKRRLKR